MQAFLEAVFALPTVLFTVPWVLSLLYWGLVIFGAADLELLDSEASLEGMLEGGEGALESFSLLSALRLKDAPLTVVLSFFSFFAWMFCLFGMRFLSEFLPGIMQPIGIFSIAVLGSYGLTRAVLAPLASVFQQRAVRGHGALVGQLCRVVSGTVSDESGQAEVDNGAAGLLLSVRSSDVVLQKGDEAVIVSYAKKEGCYLIEPLPKLLLNNTEKHTVPTGITAEKSKTV